MLRHTFVTIMLDAGVFLYMQIAYMQIAARHADPETPMRYEPVRKNLDRLHGLRDLNAGRSPEAADHRRMRTCR